jgi:hypothetical protein
MMVKKLSLKGIEGRRYDYLLAQNNDGEAKNPKEVRAFYSSRSMAIAPNSKSAGI